jgi:hypothetical protein
LAVTHALSLGDRGARFSRRLYFWFERLTNGGMIVMFFSVLAVIGYAIVSHKRVRHESVA